MEDQSAALLRIIEKRGGRWTLFQANGFGHISSSLTSFHARIQGRLSGQTPWHGLPDIALGSHLYQLSRGTPRPSQAANRNPACGAIWSAWGLYWWDAFEHFHWKAYRMRPAQTLRDEMTSSMSAMTLKQILISFIFKTLLIETNLNLFLL